MTIDNHEKYSHLNDTYAVDKNGKICICIADENERNNGTCGHILHQFGSFEDFLNEARNYNFISEETYNENINILKEKEDNDNSSVIGCPNCVKESSSKPLFDIYFYKCKLNGKDCILGCHPNEFECKSFDCSPYNEDKK